MSCFVAVAFVICEESLTPPQARYPSHNAHPSLIASHEYTMLWIMMDDAEPTNKTTQQQRANDNK